jgi:hypothetical protein
MIPRPSADILEEIFINLAAPDNNLIDCGCGGINLAA